MGLLGANFKTLCKHMQSQLVWEAGTVCVLLCSRANNCFKIQGISSRKLSLVHNLLPHCSPSVHAGQG